MIVSQNPVKFPLWGLRIVPSSNDATWVGLYIILGDIILAILFAVIFVVSAPEATRFKKAMSQSRTTAFRFGIMLIRSFSDETCFSTSVSSEESKNDKSLVQKTLFKRKIRT